jgi:hypothetical protein
MVDLKTAKVGDKVRFAEERLAYTIRARGERYLVCTKPFNPRKTVLYTVIDLEHKVRGTENLIFCAGAESDEDCAAMLHRLEGRDGDLGFTTEVSHRNRIPLRVEAVVGVTASRHHTLPSQDADDSSTPAQPTP